MTSDEIKSEAHINLALVTQRLQQTLHDIRKVLAADLKAFPGREAKKRFLEGGAFSSALDATVLSAFKIEIDGVGSGLVKSVIEDLGNDSVWLEVSGDLPDTDKRSLEWNPVVFQSLQRVADATSEVLRKHGFPSDSCLVDYKTPTWFIDGLYLPGLIENYWKGMAELRAAQNQAEEVTRVEAVQHLADRWEDA